MLETIIVLAAVALDRVTKLWASHTLTAMPFQRMTVIPGFVEFAYVENTGAAFSILEGKTWFFILVSTAVIGFLGYYLIRYRAEESLLVRITVACIIGGAIGNLFDRILHGYVVDFINPLFVRFAVFNVADIFVTCGTILFITLLLFFTPARRAILKKAVEPPAESGEQP